MGQDRCLNARSCRTIVKRIASFERQRCDRSEDLIFEFATRLTAGSAVCFAPQLRTWTVAMLSRYTFASHRGDRSPWSRRFACASAWLQFRNCSSHLKMLSGSINPLAALYSKKNFSP